MTQVETQGTGAIIQRPFGKTGAFLRTVAGLRPIQIVNRYARRLAVPRIESRTPARFRPPAQAMAPFPEREPCMLAPLRFRFLNETREVAGTWDDPAWPRLWAYNLHYFDDLNAAGADARGAWQVQMVERWLAANPPPKGTAWEPYPASLRTVNLAKWLLRTGRRDASFLRALDMSARAVRCQLEYHLLGNHLWANGKALYIAGLCLEGAEAAEWMKLGAHILEAQAVEQILTDGAHLELSPMYQGTIVEDALDLVNFSHGYGRAPPDAILQRLPAMLAWLAAMTHPDGDIGYFNDAAPGIAHRVGTLERYAQALGVRPLPQTRLAAPDGSTLEDLAASGYARLESGASTPLAAVALCDAASVGARYLPGHVHADTLSFELSLGGRRIIVNSGTSTYAEGKQRMHERSTRGHSTVELARADSSEVWASFRCGAQARIVGRFVGADADGVHLQAAHDGYRFLPGHLIHERHWQLGRNSLCIDDRVYPRRLSAVSPVPMILRFILHPEVEPRTNGADTGWKLRVAGREVARFHGDPSAAWEVEATTFAWGFGNHSGTRALVGRLAVSEARSTHCEIRFGPA